MNVQQPPQGIQVIQAGSIGQLQSNANPSVMIKPINLNQGN